MEKKIIDRTGAEVVLSATALVPIAYKHTFGCDMLKSFADIKNGKIEPVEIFNLCSKCAFIMSEMHNRETDFVSMMTLKLEDYYAFLMRFDSDYFSREKTTGAVFDTWFNNAETTDHAKNPPSPLNAK